MIIALSEKFLGLFLIKFFYNDDVLDCVGHILLILIPDHIISNLRSIRAGEDFRERQLKPIVDVATLI